MSKIELDDVVSGYNLSKINTNFERIEDELNNKVLYRDNTEEPSEPNSMQNNLDMNSNDILNTGVVYASTLVLGGETVIPTDLGTIDIVYPVQTGNAGKVLTTNGTDVSWGDSSTNFADPSDVAKGDALIGVKRTLTSAISTNLHNFIESDFIFLKRDFGAVGDGVTNDATAIQAFLNACQNKVGVIEAGYTFLSNSQLNIKTGTKLFMYGATVKAGASLSAAVPLLINSVFDGTDTGIEIYGGTFQGNTGVRTAELVSMLRVLNLKIDGTRFTANQYIGLALGGCVRFRLNNIAADNCGKVAVTSNGGAAVWIGTYLTFPSQHGIIDVPRIRDCEWHGMHIGGSASAYVSDIIVNSPQIYSVKEAGIFGPYSEGLQITSPYIVGVTQKDISSNGIELGCVDFSIKGGYISDCDSSCIALTDCQVGFVGGGLVTKNARRNAIEYPTGSHISIITTQASPNQPRYLTVEGHTSYDATSPSFAAVELGNAGDAALAVMIQNNNYSGTPFTSGDPLYIASGKWGAGCVRRNNAGSWDYDGGVGANRGDASVTLEVGVDKEVQRFSSALSANRAITLSSTTAYEGAKFSVIRTGLGAFTLSIGGVYTIPASTAAVVDVVFSGSVWVLAGVRGL